jgi:hypothetical protein
MPVSLRRQSASYIETRDREHAARTRKPGRSGARVRNEYIEAPKMRCGSLHCALGGGGVAHVDGKHEHVNARSYTQNGSFCLLERRSVTRNERERRAGAREGEYDGLPDATRGAGHQSDLASEHLCGVGRGRVNGGVDTAG